MKNMKREPTLQNIWETVRGTLETVEFIRDHAATKEDLMREIAGIRRELQQAVKTLDAKMDRVQENMATDLEKAKDEMLNHVDGFAKLYKDNDTELNALVAHYKELEEKVNMIIKHLGLKLS